MASSASVSAAASEPPTAGSGLLTSTPPSPVRLLMAPARHVAGRAAAVAVADDPDPLADLRHLDPAEADHPGVRVDGVGAFGGGGAARSGGVEAVQREVVDLGPAHPAGRLLDLEHDGAGQHRPVAERVLLVGVAGAGAEQLGRGGARLGGADGVDPDPADPADRVTELGGRRPGDLDPGDRPSPPARRRPAAAGSPRRRPPAR